MHSYKLGSIPRRFYGVGPFTRRLNVVRLGQTPGPSPWIQFRSSSLGLRPPLSRVTGWSFGRSHRPYTTAPPLQALPRMVKVALTATAMLLATVTALRRPPSEPARTPEEQYVHDRLTEHARVWTGLGRVAETHSTWVASNDPVEDRMKIVQLPDNRYFLGVYDGHAGWQCAELLSQVFHNYIARHLRTSVPGSEKDALVAAYDEMDGDLMGLSEKVKRLPNIPIQQKQDILMPAMAGAVVVTAVVDGNKVHVAHAGDCRAVVGRRVRANTFTAVELTQDHGAENPSEVKRMQEEHPGEESTVLMRGRVLGGLMPTRSMGDSRYKWSHEIQEWISEVFASSSYKYKGMPRHFKTPPYVTAHPEAATYKLDDNDLFMVLATDGLWEKMTSEQVVDAIGEYLEQFEKGTWAHQDANAAAHLVRNAFGGRDTQTVASLLKIPAPQSRWHRDDISVTVVFFKAAEKGKSVKQPDLPGKQAPENVDLARSRIDVDPRAGLVLGPDTKKAKL